MQVLRSRLLKLRQDEQEARASAERRAQIGGGGRGEKIRTYNFKENRITDHRIGFTLYQLESVLGGDLDSVVDALAADLRTRRLAGDA
jgi:peptide chain release factor 1